MADTHVAPQFENARPSGRHEFGVSSPRGALAWTLLGVASTVGMVVLLVSWMGYLAYGIDDADITLVYARNIAAGHGYVYSPGGERVEGSTSLLWTLLCALAFRLADEPRWIVSAFGLLLTSIAVCAAQGLSASMVRTDSNAAPRWTAFLLLACPTYFVWAATTQMDLGLWSAVITVALACALSMRRAAATWGLAGCLALLVLTRPEGLVLGPALVGIALLTQRQLGRTWADAVRLGLPAAAVLLVTIGLTLVFRLQYFGYPLPNTYYAKVGDDRLFTAWLGFKYVVAFLVFQPIHLFALPILVREGHSALPSLRTSFRAIPDEDGPASLPRASVVRLGVAAILILLLLLPLVEGKDHFAGARLMQPFVPLSCALLAAELVDRKEWLTRAALGRGLAGLSLLVVLAGWLRFANSEFYGLGHEFNVARGGKRDAEVLRTWVEKDEHLPSVGVTAAGAFAFAYRGKVFDLLGLNWLAMAHASSDRRGPPGHAAFSSEVFWSSPPDLLLFNALRERPRDACDVYRPKQALERAMLRSVLSTERFRDTYRAVAAQDRGIWYAAFAKNSWLQLGLMSHVQQLDWPNDSLSIPGCTATSQ